MGTSRKLISELKPLTQRYPVMDHFENYNRNLVRINVAGTIFQCYSNTLSTFKESKLAQLEKHTNNYDMHRNEYFFDRNPFMFNFILDACRKGTIHIPKDVCGTSFMDELKFWGMPPSHVAPCCWEALYKSEQEESFMRKLVHNLKVNSCSESQGLRRWRKNLWLILDQPSSSVPAMIWAGFISMLIIVATLSEALASLPAFHVNFTESENRVVHQIGQLLDLDNYTHITVGQLKPHPYLIITDASCHLVLALEFLTAFIVCPQRRAYILSPVRITVLLGYVSFWIAFVMEVNLEKINSVSAIWTFLIFKYLSILQLARFFYFTKRITAFSIMDLTFTSSVQELKVLGMMLGILMCVFGYIIFVAELFDNSKIDNVFVGMYWALITLTTVGYGDYFPITVPGRVVASACAICGVLVLALPIGVIATSFYTFYNYHTYAEKHTRKYGDKLQYTKHK